MSDVTIIFPHQLFEHHPCLDSDRLVILAEEFLLYRVQPFHKQRLVLMRAAMRAYEEKLLKSNRQVLYIPSEQLTCRGALFAFLAARKVTEIHIAEVVDDWLEHDIAAAVEKYGWKLHVSPTPGFLCSEKELEDYFKDKKQYSMAHFYAWQRKKLDILMDEAKPIGGKYSFDTDNRKKLPKGLVPAAPYQPKQNRLVASVVAEIENEFPNAIGESGPCIYPTTHQEALCALTDFLKNRLHLFGDYQDAIQKENSFLFHSLLSPLLNIGLLTPSEVLNTSLDYAQSACVPINSLEGFLRQIIGWREFVRASYLLKGSAQRSSNFFRNQEKIPECFWEGKTGLEPIDACIQRSLRTGYCHHIERLMVLGNFLLLTETAPDEVYKWFMANFVDAYDWVMVPNVYGMSQYADGGMIVTKPYISGSNYLLKMSNYSRGPWVEIWDGLFWRFIQIHRPVFEANHRTQTLVQLLVKNQQAYAGKIAHAEAWLKTYRKK